MRQTGSLKVRVARLPPTVTDAKLGRVVSTYVNVTAFDAGAPALVTVTFAVPTVPAGTVATMDVGPHEVTVAAVAPTLTVGNAGVQTKPVPVIVSVVPPWLPPEVGAMDVMTAAAAAAVTRTSW